MANQLIWQQEGDHPDKADNFALITQWWQNLSNQDLSWKQRVIPESGNLEELDWENQRFDETIAFETAEVRGITLYWRQHGIEQERNITPRQLVFAPSHQALYIYPQSQPQLVIRIAKPIPVYDRLEISNPLTVGTSVGDKYVLLLRDKQQQLEVKVTLDTDSLSQLIASLPEIS